MPFGIKVASAFFYILPGAGKAPTLPSPASGGGK